MQKLCLPDWLILGLVMVLATGLAGCGETASSEGAAVTPAASETGGLSAAQFENGIGPIDQVALSPLDAALAEKGEEIFTTKCAACHKFDQRYVGPPLGDVLARRTPAFIMNMMLNPAEMVEKHPEVKKLLAEFLTPMPNQNLTEEDARAILEYIRQATVETNP